MTMLLQSIKASVASLTLEKVKIPLQVEEELRTLTSIGIGAFFCENNFFITSEFMIGGAFCQYNFSFGNTILFEAAISGVENL